MRNPYQYRNRQVSVDKAPLGLSWAEVMADQRERDQRYQRALHRAMWNYEHLPAGADKPPRPLMLKG